jgi:hypothetical protein
MASEPKPFKGKIPWNKKGFAHWDGHQDWDFEKRVAIPAELRDNTPFRADVQIETYFRGRSAAGFILKDLNTGHEYPMRMSCMEHFLKNANFERGVARNCLFAVTKQGANYSLLFLPG